VVTPGYSYAYATWLGMSAKIPSAETDLVSNAWLAANIQQGHGPLGAMYPDVAYGMEGDTPAYLSLISNGLNDAEHPDFGGWGGRYAYYLPAFRDSNSGGFVRPNWPKDEPETRAIWTNAEDSLRGQAKSAQASIYRWRQAVQHDFAARMDWTTKPFAAVNHAPEVRLAHPAQFTVKAGEEFYLNASGTTDPDGDSMSYLWSQYPEAGTYPGYISTRPYSPNLYRLPIVAPKVSKPETIHFILQVTDKGSPALTRYQRVIVTVLP